MRKKISLLDCTLRDGSYINGSKFGSPAIKGIIKKMQDAGADLIESAAGSRISRMRKEARIIMFLQIWHRI